MSGRSRESRSHKLKVGFDVCGKLAVLGRF